jgi:hypothetical protein
LVLADLAVSCFGLFFLHNFIGDQSIEGGIVTPLKNLFIGHYFADLLLNVVYDHFFLHLLPLDHIRTVLIRVKLNLLYDRPLCLLSIRL